MMAACHQSTAFRDVTSIANRSDGLAGATVDSTLRDWAGLFDRVPDDVILFSIVPLLSFSASVALERCNKRMRTILTRNKGARCDAWLLRDVLGLADESCTHALTELAAASVSGVRVFHFSSARDDPAFVEEAPSLAAAVVSFAEKQCNVNGNGAREALEYTPYSQGFWTDTECVCCALAIQRAPLHQVERCKRHTGELYECSSVFRLVVLRRIWSKHAKYDTLNIVNGANN